MANAKKTKHGAPDHFTGLKLAFLSSRVVSYQQCLDSKSVGEFYNKVTRDFILKYGQDEPFYDNPDEDPPDPDNNMDGNIKDPQKPLSKETAEENAATFIRLRTVNKIWHNIVQHSDSYTEACTMV